MTTFFLDNHANTLSLFLKIFRNSLQSTIYLDVLVVCDPFFYTSHAVSISGMKSKVHRKKATKKQKEQKAQDTFNIVGYVVIRISQLLLDTEY